MTPFQRRYVAAAGLGNILDKVLAGGRLSAGDGMTLYRHPDLLAVVVPFLQA